MNDRQWGIWLITEADVDDLTRRANMGGKEEQQLVKLAEMTIARLPIGCIICEDTTNGNDAAKIGIVKPLGLLLATDQCPGFVICKACAHDPGSEEQLRTKVRDKFKIEAGVEKRVLQ